MAVAWYLTDVWRATPPSGDVTVGVKPTQSYIWEMWTVTHEDGTTEEVPQRLRPKYHIPWSLAYEEADEPAVALMRVEHTDGSEPPLEEGDYIALLDDEDAWEDAMSDYPSLKYRFTDQPYYPAKG